MKDNIAFFSHYSDAIDNPKNQALIAEYGFEGYGRFWALNEFIGKASNCKLDISKKRNKAAIANKLQLSIQEFDHFIEFLADDEECGLLKIEDGFIWTEQTQEDLGRAMSSREAAAKQRNKNKNEGDIQTVKQPSYNNDEKSYNDNKTNDKRMPTKCTDKPSLAQPGQEGQQQTAGEFFDSVVDKSGESPPVTPDSVQAAAAGINLQLGKSDASTAAGNLISHGLSTGFVLWAAAEAQQRETIKSPPGFLKKILLNIEQYQDWVNRYRSQHKKKVRQRSSHPGKKCPKCGGHIREIGNEAWCNSCRKLIWEYDVEARKWSEPAEKHSAVAL